jgi:methionyl-tRNA formyltransferase
MAGDSETGVSIMQVTAGLDSGPVYAQQAEPIAAEDTYGTLAPRLAELGSKLLLSVLQERPPERPQDDERVTYAEKITAADRELRPDLGAAQLERIVRGLTPHIGAYVDIAPVGRLGVWQARIADGGPDAGELSLEGPVPVLGTAEGALELAQVQPPGGRPMSGAEYLRGHRPRR